MQSQMEIISSLSVSMGWQHLYLIQCFYMSFTLKKGKVVCFFHHSLEKQEQLQSKSVLALRKAHCLMKEEWITPVVCFHCNSLCGSFLFKQCTVLRTDSTAKSAGQRDYTTGHRSTVVIHIVIHV